MNVDEDFPYISRCYFRLATSQIDHERFEYDFEGLLGDIGGIAEVMSKTFVFFIGGFLSFHSSIEIMKDLYSEDAAIKDIQS